MSKHDHARPERPGAVGAPNRAPAPSPTEDPRPLGGYLALLGTYLASATVVWRVLRRRGETSPPRAGPMDVVLSGLAIQRLTRTIAKDSVTAPLRAPFTRFAGPAGEGESDEEPSGRGLRHAVGELLTCPFCLGQWVATGMVAGTAAAPNVTGVAIQVLALAQVNDYLQLAYGALRTSSS